jgi:hypothetical protein
VGGAVEVLRPDLPGLVFLDQDQPAGPLVQRVVLDARFAVNAGDRCLEDCDHLGAVLGEGKAVTTTTRLISGVSLLKCSCRLWRALSSVPGLVPSGALQVTL